MIGTTVAGRYEILGELGRGGMGVVFRARDTVLGRLVALKLVSPSVLGPGAEERLRREAEAVARLDHPAIVTLYDVGRHEGSLFYLMPVVEGASLRSLQQKGSLRLAEVLDVGVQVAEALDYCHAHGVVHRDVKPENVMVSGEGDSLRVRVMDFGLARSESQEKLTSEGMLVGTLTYISPEQVAGAPADARSDLYSLATVLYECLTGEPPFSGPPHALLYRIAHEVPRPPRLLGAEIDVELEELLLRCLSKYPSDRPQRASHLAEALRHHRASLDEPSGSRVVASHPTSAALVAPPPSAFVGRQGPLAELQRRLEAALAGECRLVLVSGEAGVGKSRLLEELEQLATARSIRVLHGWFVDKDQAFAYQGFSELIRDWFRTSRGSAPPDLSDLAGDLLALFPALGEVPEFRAAGSGATPRREAGAEVLAQDRTPVYELLARTLSRLGAGQPLVLLLENLHGAAESVEALAYVVRRLGAMPILIVGTYRPSEVDRHHSLQRMVASFQDDPRFSAVDLGPLSPAESKALLERLLPGGALAPDLVQRLYEAAEGNPFFTRELVRSLLDAGGIARDESGVFRLAHAGLSPEALPRTIQQAVTRRVERLPEELREVLQVASVLGRSFEGRDLEALVGREGFDDVLDRLLEEGLLEEDRLSRGDRLAFASGVVRDVLYGALSRRRRRTLHRRHAEQLESRHAGRLERAWPALAHHFSQGDVAEKAVAYGLKLAQVGLDAFSPEDALRALATVQEHLQDLAGDGRDALAAEADLLAARAHRMAGDVEAALRAAEGALRRLEGEGQAGRAAAVALLAVETAWQARRVDDACRWLDRGIPLARAATDPETLGHLLAQAATVANLRGDYVAARAHHEEAARVRPAAGTEPVPAGGRLVVALANPVSAEEPAAVATVEDEEVFLTAFETLVGTDDEGNLVPCLCDRWEALEGGQAFRLTLRRDVRFHDGHPLGAAEVKASLEHAARRTGAATPALAALLGVREFLAGEAPGIRGLEVRETGVLDVRLERPLPIFPVLLTDVVAAVARPGGVGTGPFRLVSRTEGRVEVVRNSDHWGPSPARLDAVEFRVAPSASAIAAALRAGEVDLARDLTPPDLDELLRDPRFRRGFREVPRRNTYFVVFRHGGPPGSDPNLRHALAGVVRSRDLVHSTLGRLAQPAVGLIPPGILGHDPGRRREALDLQQAQAWLQATDLERPLRLRAAVHPIMLDRYGALTQALFATWAQLGVDVDVVTPTMDSFLAAFADARAVDLLVARWSADYPDPDNFTHGLFDSRLGQLRAYFSTPETDRLAAQARAEPRGAVRESLYRAFEERLLETGVLIPLFHDIDYRVAGPSVAGLRLRASPPYVDYAEVGRREAWRPEAPPRSSGRALSVPLAGAFDSLDPALAWSLEQVEVVPSLFETLTRDAGGACVVPWLATRLQAEEGGRVFRVQLRDDVRFHDGRRLTARDVRWSFERLLRREDSGPRALLEPVRGARELMQGEAEELAGLRIVSSAELTLELKEPLAFFPALLSYPALAVVPEGCEPGGGSWREGCVGTGPFRLTRFEPGRQVEMEANPLYWRPGVPRSEGLVFHLGLPPEEIAGRFRSGELCLAADLLPADVEALRQDFAAGYQELPRLSTYFVAFNARRGPLADPALRRRLAGAADVDALVRARLGRVAVPAHGVIPPGLPGHDPAHRRAGAGAGSPAGPFPPVVLRAAVHPVFTNTYAGLAEGLAEAFRAAGVEVRPVTSTLAGYLEALGPGEVDLVLGRWNADYPDADTFMHGVLHSRDGLLGRLCGSPEKDALVEAARRESDPAARHSLYRGVEAALVREVTLLPLFHEQVYRFARPELQGLRVGFSMPAVPYEELWTK